MADKIERDHWPPAFVGTMEIEFIQYKGQGKTVDEIPFDELSVTLFRDNMTDG